MIICVTFVAMFSEWKLWNLLCRPQRKEMWNEANSTKMCTDVDSRRIDTSSLKHRRCHRWRDDHASRILQDCYQFLKTQVKTKHRSKPNRTTSGRRRVAQLTLNVTLGTYVCNYNVPLAPLLLTRAKVVIEYNRVPLLHRIGQLCQQLQVFPLCRNHHHLYTSQNLSSHHSG